MEKTKKRSANFSAREENILVSLVKKYKAKIECKKSDTNTNRVKSLAWQQLATDFNATSGETFRDFHILRKKYENIKKRTKQKFADEKASIKRTGGGPPISISFDEVDRNMKEIIGTQMTGLGSQFDDDNSNGIEIVECVVGDGNLSRDEMIEDDLNITNGEIDNSMTLVSKEVDVDVVDGPEPGQIEPAMLDMPENSIKTGPSSGPNTLKRKIIDWSKATPQLLRTPTSTPLRPIQNNTENISNKKHRNQRSVMNSKLIEWSAAKVDLSELQKKAFMEEHQLKMKHRQEAHECSLKLQEAESMERRKYMKEKHDLEMAILKQQNNVQMK